MRVKDGRGTAMVIGGLLSMVAIAALSVGWYYHLLP